MKTQNERLAEYLEQNESINPMQAWIELGIYRLSARCHDLRHKFGMNIKTSTVTVENQFGEDCHVAEYRLVK